MKFLGKLGRKIEKWLTLEDDGNYDTVDVIDELDRSWSGRPGRGRQYYDPSDRSIRSVKSNDRSYQNVSELPMSPRPDPTDSSVSLEPSLPRASSPIDIAMHASKSVKRSSQKGKRSSEKKKLTWLDKKEPLSEKRGDSAKEVHDNAKDGGQTEDTTHEPRYVFAGIPLSEARMIGAPKRQETEEDWSRSFLGRWKKVKRRARLQAAGVRNIWQYDSPESKSHQVPELLIDDVSIHNNKRDSTSSSKDTSQRGTKPRRDESLSQLLLGEVAEVC